MEKRVKNYEQDIQELYKFIENTSIKIEKKEKRDLQNNIFTILKVEDVEVRHSNFLAYLLQNNVCFLKLFLCYKKICNLDSQIVEKLIKTPIDVNREYKKEMHKRSIDIVMSFPEEKFVVVIENKIYSSEGENQLSDYYNYINDSTQFVGYTKKYIYLTLQGDLPEREEDRLHWSSVSYAAILDILLKTKRKNNTIQDILIGNYIDILKEKTVIVMDRVQDYYNLYKKNRELMVEMSSYIPQIAQRADIQRDYIKTRPELMLQSENQNVFMYFTNNEVCAHLQKHGLKQDMILFYLDNEPHNKMSFCMCVDKDTKNKYKQFAVSFREVFNRKDKSRNADYIVLYKEPLLISDKARGYLTEKEFQNQMRYVMKDLFETKDSVYYKIVDFILKYNFD